MKQNQLFIVLVIAILIIIGLSAYLFFKQGSNKPSKNDSGVKYDFSIESRDYKVTVPNKKIMIAALQNGVKVYDALPSKERNIHVIVKIKDILESEPKVIDKKNSSKDGIFTAELTVPRVLIQNPDGSPNGLNLQSIVLLNLPTKLKDEAKIDIVKNITLSGAEMILVEKN